MHEHEDAEKMLAESGYYGAVPPAAGAHPEVGDAGPAALEAAAEAAEREAAQEGRVEVRALVGEPVPFVEHFLGMWQRLPEWQ